MKTIKSVLAIVLAFAMIFCFAGCAKEKELPQAALTGKWTSEIDLTDALGQELAGEFDSMGMEGFDMGDAELLLYMVMEFEEDGSCYLYLDEEATAESMKGYFEVMIDAMVEWMYKTLEDQAGMSREEIDELYENQLGMSIEEYMDSSMDDYLNGDAIMESFEDVESQEGFYKLEGDKLYITEDKEDLADCEDYVTCNYSATTMTIDTGSDASVFEDLAELGVELPLTFERD